MNLLSRIKARFWRPRAPLGRPFQVGDRVITHDPAYSFGPQKGVITKVYHNGCYAVRLDSHQPPTDLGGLGWTFFTKELKFLH